VLDLDHGPSGVIGDRAFHRDARVVTMLAKSLMHGLLRAGMAACGKHFPGHGYVAADSHTEVPVDERTLDAILGDDAAPYGWLSTSLPSVMPAHVVYPEIDRRPAGFSKKWLQQVLRGRLGFTGAIFSDDLSMAGARHIDGRELSYADAAVETLNVFACEEPVPAISMAFFGDFIFMATARITSAMPASSSCVSPFAVKAVSAAET